MAFEQFLIELSNLTINSPFLHLLIFGVSILAIHHLLKSIIHVGLAGIAGVAFLFLSNNLLGTAFPTDFKTLLFFATAGTIVYFAAAISKKLINVAKK